ncbi:hypothetical protein BGZ70_000027 [Mortierella alpina]|uniref:Uncharacterized protein n=1 Tax=Mortierella alpina TaxID=64518 RepID=A0A9P6M6P1_MORAP|nr:hypothetical protein BGZ70_000027 [Mortierella alpina]
MSGPSPKRGRGILKPKIVTAPSPKLESIPQLEAAAELTPTGARSPGMFNRQGAQSSRSSRGRTADEGAGRSAMNHRRSSSSSHDLLDHRMACLKTRTKIFLQNVEEETRLVLSCFPSEFSIGTVPLSSANPPTTTTAPATPVAQPVAEGVSTAASDPSSLPGLTQYPEGEQLNLNDQARSHQSRPSLTVPTRRTPSITIQDQSYLTPSPIHPLPSAIAGGGQQFRTSLERAEENDTVPFLLGSPPPSTAKERRSKSVLFSHRRPMDHTASDINSSLLNPTAVLPLPTATADSSHSISPINGLPAFSVTESSPPMPSSSSSTFATSSQPFSPPLPGLSSVTLPPGHTAAAAVADVPTQTSGHPTLNVHFTKAEKPRARDPNSTSLAEPLLIPELRIFTPGASPSLDQNQNHDYDHDHDHDHDQSPSTSTRQDADPESTPPSPPVPYNVIGLGVRNAGPAQESSD